jgi:predicted O-methyltransferase YrrM
MFFTEHNIRKLVMASKKRTVKETLQGRAVEDAADYAEQHMAFALAFNSRVELWNHALGRISFDGLIAEFGVWKGESINHFAHKLPGKRIYGFDSFEGLSADWPGTSAAKGHFDLGGRLPKVESNVELVKGWFDETLPPFLNTHPGNFAFVHIDCDTYEATRIALSQIAERLAPGTIIVFDEYFGFLGWRNGEFKAWGEFCAERSVHYRYLGFADAQVAVAIE